MIKISGVFLCDFVVPEEIHIPLTKGILICFTPFTTFNYKNALMVEG